MVIIFSWIKHKVGISVDVTKRMLLKLEQKNDWVTFLSSSSCISIESESPDKNKTRFGSSYSVIPNFPKLEVILSSRYDIRWNHVFDLTVSFKSNLKLTCVIVIGISKVPSGSTSRPVAGYIIGIDGSLKIINRASQFCLTNALKNLFKQMIKINEIVHRW